MGRGAAITLYTIGHSTRSEAEFVSLLNEFEIAQLIDIRSLPGSRKWPQFDRENLQAVLPGAGIEYVGLKELGGRRGKRKGFDSPNTGLYSPAFRNYADFMLTAEFREGVRALLALARRARSAVMCAEALFWRCHRRLLSDYLVGHRVNVLHILGHKQLREHTMTQGAIITPKGTVLYPPPTQQAA